MEINAKIKKFNVEMEEIKNNCATKPLLIGVDTYSFADYIEEDRYVLSIMNILDCEKNALYFELKQSGLVNKDIYVCLNCLYNCSKTISEYLLLKDNEQKNYIQTLHDDYIKYNNLLMIYVTNKKDVDQIRNMLSYLAAMLTCHKYLYDEAIKTITIDETKTVPDAIVRKKIQKPIYNRMPE